MCIDNSWPFGISVWRNFRIDDKTTSFHRRFKIEVQLDTAIYLNRTYRIIGLIHAIKLMVSE